MNKDNAKDYLPLVQALADGKVIQGRLFILNPWKDCAHPDFTMDPSNYRIKPEPREIWVNEYPEGDCHTHFSAESDAQARGVNRYAITRKYREVIE